MATYDKGTAVLIEVEFQRQTPFGSLAYFDPTSPLITVLQPGGAEIVTDAALTKSDTGKYYYVLQTAETWTSGTYGTEVTGVDGSYTARDVNTAAFKLE